MTFVSYAQNYEDVVLWRALQDVRDGFYIDIGAAHPTIFSVTNAFYERGWHGINIEPTAEYFGALAAARGRDVNINALIGERPGIVTFYEFASLGLSTMNVAIAQRHMDAGIDHRTISMPVLTLASVCETRGMQPIHFLKIDVEGAEREVLLSMDFARYRPWIVVIEATEPMQPVSTRAQWEDVILEADYLFAYHDGLNAYYVAREQRHLIETLAIQPNVFDDFIQAREFELRKEAEAWRLGLIERQAMIDDLDKSLAAERADRAALETAHQTALAALETAHRKDRAALEIAHRHAVEALEYQLYGMLASFSWRATAPLRLLSLRFPGAAPALRRFASRHPKLRRLVVTVVKGAWRIARRQSPGASAPVSGPARQAPMKLVSPVATADAKSWIFMGDTLQWLETHRQLSGVGKVTTEVFLASLHAPPTFRLLPCVPTPTPVGLRSISLRDIAADLSARRGDAAAIDMPVLDHLPSAITLAPKAGDHVLFSGVVWTTFYADLFLSLRKCDIRFSVFVYDIIPLLQPEFVTPASALEFTHWLKVALREAECVFVSGEVVRDDLLRWAVRSNVYVSAQVHVVQFGTSMPPRAVSQNPAAWPAVRRGNFVLSVGTVDRRKNQVLLCRSWLRLIRELGRNAVPQLVLVGRDDLNLAGYDAELAPLIESGDILVLQGVSDAELADFYRDCQFTAFPSLSEGYGLPVSESLSFGKLCIAADLPVIREHAGDLPWYFAPGDAQAAYETLRRAILDVPARVAAEAQIRAGYRPRDWRATAQTIAAAMQAPPCQVLAGEPPARLAVGGVLQPAIPPTLARAAKWCVENEPEVSILIVNWNAAPLTRMCLEQIWANTDGVRYEVIIADNGSGDVDLRCLEALGRGVRLLSLGANRYFGEACNIAAEEARGKYICLLNNDCFGQPGWLTALVETLRADPMAGAAGPLFLFPDGSVQEAGGKIDENGYPVRFGRGERLLEGAQPDYMLARAVDYISAAALLVPRDVFLRAGGFDLRYEPAYYEDADLCLKLRAMGLSVKFCPQARAIHIEGAAANDDPVAEARRKALGDLNRGKFVGRWARYLTSRSEDDLAMIAREIFVGVPVADPPRQPGRKTAALYTPYTLTAGGGERVLLAIAALLLQRGYQVVLVTPHRYSALRLRNIGHDFGIDVAGCQPVPEPEFLAGPPPDLMITLGNHVIPPLPPRTENSFFICQFPFPLPADMRYKPGPGEPGYRGIIVYSEYTKAHVLAALSAHRMPPWPVEVVYPPVPQVAGTAAGKKPMILTVGRFFAGGHSKRHDLLIGAFRRLMETFDGALELHIAGSSMPQPEHMRYLDELTRMAAGLPVTFHVNASETALFELYRNASIYWHATGLGVDLVNEPSKAEHFGISLVEAMSAECVPMAYKIGGPREIITHGVDGYLYGSVEELVALTGEVMGLEAVARREAIGRAAGRRARDFAPDIFDARILEVLAEDRELVTAIS